jgi:hypothetical protein
VIVKVLVEEWELEESGRVLSVGDEVSFWLTFQEADGVEVSAEEVQTIQGVARPLPTWAGGKSGRHPVHIDIAGGALYWDAPAPFEGAVEVAGRISSNIVDAPDGFPETRGVVRRLRMVWHEYANGPDGMWTHERGGPRYEEVSSTYLPAIEAAVPDPEVEAEMRRQARQAYDRELAAGRLNPGDSFEVGIKVPHTARKVPSGTTESRWTGALIDLETADSLKE